MRSKTIIGGPPENLQRQHESAPHYLRQDTKVFTYAKERPARAFTAAARFNRKAGTRLNQVNTNIAEHLRYAAGTSPWRGLTSGSNRSLRSLGRAKARPLTKR